MTINRAQTARREKTRRLAKEAGKAGRLGGNGLGVGAHPALVPSLPLSPFLSVLCWLSTAGGVGVTEREISGIASVFTPIFGAVIQEVGLTGAVVLGRVWRYCQAKGRVCWAFQGRMAREVGLRRETFNRWLSRLCNAGYLEDITPDRRNRPPYLSRHRQGEDERLVTWCDHKPHRQGRRCDSRSHRCDFTDPVAIS
jgi:hypothetical protein